jgi:hypothetical protein
MLEIWPKPGCSGHPLGICHNLEGIAAFEGATRARCWKLKGYGRAGHRTAVLIGHLDDWLTACAASQIVDRALLFGPFDNCDV